MQTDAECLQNLNDVIRQLHEERNVTGGKDYEVK